MGSRGRKPTAIDKICRFCGADWIATGWVQQQRGLCQRCRAEQKAGVPKPTGRRKPEFIEKTCAVCGERFERPRYSGSRYNKSCSPLCRRVLLSHFTLQNRWCEFCGVEFHPADHTRRFCARECSTSYKTMMRVHCSRTHTVKLKRTLRWSVCVVCGDRFVVRLCGRKTCSGKCRSLLRATTARAWRANRSARTCRSCGCRLPYGFRKIRCNKCWLQHDRQMTNRYRRRKRSRRRRGDFLIKVHKAIAAIYERSSPLQ